MLFLDDHQLETQLLCFFNLGKTNDHKIAYATDATALSLSRNAAV